MLFLKNYHMDNEDYWDIGYNFLIGGDGSVYEGRGWDTVGAHAGVTYYNQNGLGNTINPTTAIITM